MRNLVSKLLGHPSQEPDEPVKDYSLHSGERQTASEISEIRKDHVVRYIQAIEIFGLNQSQSSPLRGLDLFCANGYGTSMLANQLNCWILGIDASEEAIAQAQSHYATPNSLYSVKLFPFPLPAETFDFITCIESLEHTEHYEDLARQMLNSLRTGGILFLSTPNEDVMPFCRDEMPFHVKHFREPEVMGLMAEGKKTELIGKWGQDVYEYKENERLGLLPEDQMSLKEGYSGQFQVWAFKKNSS